MSHAIRKSDVLAIVLFAVSKNKLTATISDGRVISVPLSWFPRLANARPHQLQSFEISPGGYGVHWPDLDEDISIKSFLEGF